MTDELQYLKTENQKLREQVKEMQEYADFKRDFHKAIRSPKWWLKAILLVGPIIGFIIWDEIYRNQAARADRFFSEMHGGIILSVTAGLMLAIALYRLPALVKWWKSR